MKEKPSWIRGYPLAFDRQEYLEERIQQLHKKTVTTAATTTTTTPASNTGTKVQQLLTVTATESPSKQQDRTCSLVTVSFTRDPSDKNFAGARIWFTGYKGNTQPQLMTAGGDSPISFLCESTKETVTVTAQPFSSLGLTADFSTSPTTTVMLDGVVSAPPAPTVVQTCLPIAGGVQFTFTQLSGLLNDVVDSYRVYRNTTNTSGTATVIQTIKHNPRNSGNVTVQDSQVLANVSYYYWISAVNTSGLESSLTAAGNSQGNFAVPVETVNLFANPALNSTGSLPGVGALTPEQWQGGQIGSTGSPEYRNGREIRIPKLTSVGGSNTCYAVQFKNLARFKPSAQVTLSFRVRRGGLVSNPTGTFTVQIQPAQATTGLGLAGGTSFSTTAINVSDLSSTSYILYRITGTLTPQGGQGMWGFFLISNTADDDLFFTEPMLNIGADAAPFTTNTFLTDVAQYAYEGDALLSDTFSDTNGTGLLITNHYPSGTGTQTTGKGQTYTHVTEAGSPSLDMDGGTPSTKCSLTAAADGANHTAHSQNKAPAQSVAYYVQADCEGGVITGTIGESGVIGRYADANNFYLGRIQANGTVELYKRVAGAYTALGSYASGLHNATIKLQITDATKKVFVNGTERISSTDNALTAAGSAGFRLGVTATAITTKPSIDNLTAVYVQNVAAPATPPTPPAPPDPINYDPVVNPDKRTL